MDRLKRNDRGEGAAEALLGAGIVVVGLLLVFGLLVGSWFGIKAMHRHQALADANNRVQVARIEANNKIKLNEIEIASQAQRVKVAQQEAQIRFEQAKGVREAQDEIAKTLTPLYVQFEMVDALKVIAQSGRNNTVVYIPSGANGIPLVSGAAGSPTVTGAK